jgi:RNA polymerase sigma-70 factor (ECF subfamily)
MSDERKLKRVLSSGDVNRIHNLYDDIYNTYKGLVCYVIAKYINVKEDIYDIAQEVFIDFFNNASNVKSNIKSYLTISAKNKSLNHLKKSNKMILVDCKDIDLLDDNPINNHYVFKEIIETLKQSLSQDEYKILILHIFENYTFKEISTKLKSNESTIKSIYFRTIKKSRKILKRRSIYE